MCRVDDIVEGRVVQCTDQAIYYVVVELRDDRKVMVLLCQRHYSESQTWAVAYDGKPEAKKKKEG